MDALEIAAGARVPIPIPDSARSGGRLETLDGQPLQVPQPVSGVQT